MPEAPTFDCLGKNNKNNMLQRTLRKIAKFFQPKMRKSAKFVLMRLKCFLAISGKFPTIIEFFCAF